MSVCFFDWPFLATNFIFLSFFAGTKMRLATQISTAVAFAGQQQQQQQLKQCGSLHHHHHHRGLLLLLQHSQLTP